MLRLWVDDLREPPDDTHFWARTYEEAILYLLLHVHEIGDIVIHLDHDLGGEHTGYDLACWIERQFFETGVAPKMVWCHSQNPVGRKRIEQVIAQIYTKHTMDNLVVHRLE